MKDVINLFKNNVLARETLKNSILEFILKTKKTRLVGLCETRFIEWHEAVNVFVELFEPIIVSLQNIQETDRAVPSKTCSLLAFIILQINTKSYN